MPTNPPAASRGSQDEIASLQRQLQQIQQRLRELTGGEDESAKASPLLREAQEQLRASEASKRAVWESSLDGIITMDHEGVITDFNPGAERIFGHLKSALVGRPLVAVLIPPALRERYRHGFQKRLVAGEGRILGRHVEISGLRVDGTEFPIELTIVAVTDCPNPLFVATIRDISERKRAEEERDRLFDLSLDMLCVANFKGWLEQVNPAWTECLGWSAAELTGRPMNEFILPEDRDLSTQIRKRIHEGESIRGFENRYRCKDGSYRWLSWNVHPLPESSKVFAVARDVTAQKQAAEHLREREAILASAQRMGRMGNWNIDVRGSRLVWSEATCDLFGIAPDEFTETFAHFYSFILPEDRPHYDAEHGRRFSTNPLLEARSRIRRPDGEVRWMYERGHVEFDAEGQELRRSGMVMDITELKAGEEAREQLFEQLRASEQQYRVLFQNNPIPMWAFDVETLRFLAVNDTAVQQYGYSQAEFLGMTIREIRPAAEVPGLERRLAELPGDQNGSGLWQHRKKDGAIIDVEIFADHAVFNGRPARLVLAFDVTERLRGERELSRTHRALKMLGSGNEAMIRAESEQALLGDICQIAVEIGGYRMAWVGYAMADATKSIAPQAFAGIEDDYLTAVEITWNEDAASGQGPVGQVIRGGQVVTVPDLAAEPSFAPWQEAAAARGFRSMIVLPLRQQGRSFGALMLYLAEARSVLADELQLLQELADNLAFGIVTLRVRAERQRLQGAVLAIAQESERAAAQVREQAALLDKAQDAIVVRDLEHHITYWNKSAERLFGWTAEEAHGRLFPELLEVDGKKFQEANQAVRASGEWTGEIQKRARDGHQLNLDSRWTLVCDEWDQPQSILSIDTDITERRKLEQQILRAQRMESIGTLAGGIAHDLNNALGPIITALELLQMRFPDQASQDLISTIRDSARRGADMVKQVLSFGRGVEGQRVEIQLKHVIKEVEKIANDTFLKHIWVQTAVPQDLWAVVGDPTQLHQVLLNLCVNARDAMPNGGTLTISAENIRIDAQYAGLNLEAKPGPHVVIRVEDTGTGMTPQIMDKIFDPFYTTKELGKGTGLGLSTSLGIVNSHGGFIRVSSEPGKGTKFRVYLPAQTKASGEGATAAATQMPRGNGELILVIDDEAAVRKVTQHTLQAFGYRVLVAVDGTEAVATYAQSGAEIAVVLTDMMMPGLDGPETIQILRKMNPVLPIIAASGLSTESQVTKAKSLGVNHFLPKPYTAEALLKVLRQILVEKP